MPTSTCISTSCSSRLSTRDFNPASVPAAATAGFATLPAADFASAAGAGGGCWAAAGATAEMAHAPASRASVEALSARTMCARTVRALGEELIMASTSRFFGVQSRCMSLVQMRLISGVQSSGVQSTRDRANAQFAGGRRPRLILLRRRAAPLAGICVSRSRSSPEFAATASRTSSIYNHTSRHLHVRYVGSTGE